MKLSFSQKQQVNAQVIRVQLMMLATLRIASFTLTSTFH